MMVPVFDGRPAGKVDNPILWRNEEPQPFARIPYCSNGSMERRPMKTVVPRGEGSLTPRWMRSICFLPSGFAGSVFGSEELMLVDLEKFVDGIGVGEVMSFSQ